MIERFTHIGHLAAMVLFALLVSIALACMTRRTWPARARYTVRTFLLFILVGAGIAWLMYPFSR